MTARAQTATVKVPASTSNLGSGFDTLGLAVGLYNRVTLHRQPGLGLTLAWPVAPRDRPWFEGAVAEAAALFFRTFRIEPFGLKVQLREEIPIARGLGASATIRVGVLGALNAVCGQPASSDDLLTLATALEGHPDNASPAIHGGFTVSGTVSTPDSKQVRCLRFPVSARLKLITLVPRIGISTEHARRLLPKRYAKADAVHALNRAALITAALSSQRYSELRGLFDDRIHQPYRAQLLPRLSAVIQAGERAGALGGFLSGSGSSIICLALTRPDAIARAMHRALPDSEIRILTADNRGLTIESPPKTSTRPGRRKRVSSPPSPAPRRSVAARR